MITLNENDKKFLLEQGYLEEDLEQIQEGSKKVKLTDEKQVRLTCRQAIKKLGREDFLTGMARASFHWSAIRHVNKTQEKEYVYFDCSKMFK